MWAELRSLQLSESRLAFKTDTGWYIENKRITNEYLNRWNLCSLVIDVGSKTLELSCNLVYLSGELFIRPWPHDLADLGRTKIRKNISNHFYNFLVNFFRNCLVDHKDFFKNNLVIFSKIFFILFFQIFVFYSLTILAFFIGIILSWWFSDKTSSFLEKNKLYR